MGPDPPPRALAREDDEAENFAFVVDIEGGGGVG